MLMVLKQIQIMYMAQYNSFEKGISTSIFREKQSPLVLYLQTHYISIHYITQYIKIVIA